MNSSNLKYTLPITVLIIFITVTGGAAAQSDTVTADVTHTPQNPAPDEEVTLSATDSSTPNGYTVTYNWDTTNNGVYDNGQGETLSTSFQNPGERTVSVKVTASNSNQTLTDTATDTIQVTPRTPNADFTYSPENPVPNEEVTFTADPENANGGEIRTYQWTVQGETVPQNTDTLTRTFTTQGEYTISLQTTLENGETASSSTSFTVENTPPTPDITYSPSSPTPDDTVTFSAADSTDAEGEITGYQWVIGDETYTGETVTKQLSPSGTYSIQLTVTDNFGASNTVTESLTVQWNDAVDDTDSTDTSSTGTPGRDERGDDEEPGADDTVINPEFDITRQSPTENVTTVRVGDTLSFIASIDSYRVPDADVRLLVDGRVVSSSDVDAETIRKTHTFNSPGSHTVRLEVDDGDGQKKLVTWDVVTHTFNAKPVFAEQSSTSTITTDGSAEILTFSVENPGVNSNDVVAGISAQPPDGVSISEAQNSAGSAAIQTTSGVISPGGVQSMRLVISVTDESLRGETITVPYQTRYYAVDDPDQVYLSSREQLTVTVGGDGDSESPSQPTESPGGIPETPLLGGIAVLVIIALLKL